MPQRLARPALRAGRPLPPFYPESPKPAAYDPGRFTPARDAVLAVGQAAGVAARFKLEADAPFRAVDAQALRARLRALDAEVDA